MCLCVCVSLCVCIHANTDVCICVEARSQTPASFLRGHPPYFLGQGLSLNLKSIGSGRLAGEKSSYLCLQVQGSQAYAAAPGLSYKCWSADLHACAAHILFTTPAIHLSSHSLGHLLDLLSLNLSLDYLMDTDGVLITVGTQGRL